MAKRRAQDKGPERERGGGYADPEAAGAGTTLGDLLRASGLAPSPPAPAGGGHEAAAPDQPPTTPAAARDAIDLADVARAVIRRDRKRRKGKTVTLIAGLPGDDDARLTIARALGRALGCGAALEGDEVLLQGDMLTRARRWLEARGVRRVVQSGG